MNTPTSKQAIKTIKRGAAECIKAAGQGLGEEQADD